MPRISELKSEESAGSSPLRRSSRNVAVSSPHPLKGRRLSASSENNGADEKTENKPARAKRAASVTKEETPKVEPAKPRTRRSSASAEPTVAVEEKREPATRSRRSSATEEPSQETPKPVRTRRSSHTDDAAEDGKSKTITRRKSISREPSEEKETPKPATRSRRRSMDKDVDSEILEKKPTRQRRASTELEEPETKVAKLAPVKSKRRPSITDNAVVLDPIVEVEAERRSLSPLPVKDESPRHIENSVKSKQEPSKADLNLSVINECSFTEGNSSHTEEATSTSEMSSGSLKESGLVDLQTKGGKDEIGETFAATTPSKESNSIGRKSSTPKKSPLTQNNTDNPIMSPELRVDLKKEALSEAVLSISNSKTSDKVTPEKMPKLEVKLEISSSVDKLKKTTISPRKSPRNHAGRESRGDRSEEELQTPDSDSTIKNINETSVCCVEKIQPSSPDKEKPKNIDDPKDSASQKHKDVESEAALESEGSFKVQLSSSGSDLTPEDELNLSKSSNSSDKENVAVDIDNGASEAKVQRSAEKKVLRDLSVVTELKQATTVARVSNVFRPKNIDFSFVEPMDVDKTTVDLESSTTEKSGGAKLLSGASDDSIDESFKLNLSVTYVESPVIDRVFKDELDVSSGNVTSDSNALIVDTSEASCATPSEEAGDVVVSKNPTSEIEAETNEPVVPEITSNCNVPADLEECVEKPVEPNASKIVEHRSNEEKPMSPDYDFQLPSDDSGSEIDNKISENPPSPNEELSKETSPNRDVEKDGDMVYADKELESSKEEKCSVDQPEQSSATNELIENKEICDVDQEITEAVESPEIFDAVTDETENKENCDESGRSETVLNQKVESCEKQNCSELLVQPKQSTTVTELIENKEVCDVEKDETEIGQSTEIPDAVINVTDNENDMDEFDRSETILIQKPDETREKRSYLDISTEDKDIEQKSEKNVEDEGKIDHMEEEIESNTNEDKNTVNNSVAEELEVNNPNVTLENSSENENNVITDSEGISTTQVGDEAEKTTKEASETSNDDLKTEEKLLDASNPPERENVEPCPEVQTSQSPESLKIPSGIEPIETEQQCVSEMSEVVPTEKQNETPKWSSETILADEDSARSIVNIDSVVNEDEAEEKFAPSTDKIDDYDEMESSFKDIVKGDEEVEPRKESELPVCQPKSETKKTKKSKQLKEGRLDIKSDVKEILVEPATEDSVLDKSSSKTPKKAKKTNKKDAAADKIDETIADTDQNAPNNVGSASDRVLIDHPFESEKTENEEVDQIGTAEYDSEETIVNADIKSIEESFAKTPKKTKKKSKVVKASDDSTRSLPTDEPTSEEVESTSKISKKKKNSKRTELSERDEKDAERGKKVTNKSFSLKEWFGDSSEDKIKQEGISGENPKSKETRKKSKLANSENAGEKTRKKDPLEGFSNAKLDEIIEKKLLEIKSKNKKVIAEEKASLKEFASEEEYATEEEYSSEDEEDCEEENPYIDTMAEEGEEDTPSEGSNDIIDDGESINTTESDHETDDDYDDDDSFICDEDVIELLSGNEYDLEDEKSKKKKKSRIINLEECDSDVIKIETKEKPVEPKKRSRIISVSSSSGDEGNDSTKEDEVLEHEPSVELQGEKSSEKPRPRKSSITIIENINVNDIKDTVLSQRIHQLVDGFCTTVPRQGDISMNLSLQYAGEDEETSSETKKDKSKSMQSPNLQTSTKKTKKKPKDARKRSISTDETAVPTKKPKLSVSLDNIEDLQEDEEKSNKRKRLSRSLEEINVNKSKKKKKKAKKNWEKEEEVSTKKRRYSDDSRTETFGLINQLLTDVKNRPRRVVKPSTSKMNSDSDNSWDVEVVNVKPSTSIVSKKEIENYKSKKLHPKDFRNQMLYDSSRVKRIETKKLLRKKGAYS